MYTLNNVTKTYRGHTGELTALRNVTLTIPDGEWVAVQGPTGGGKSTLLQLLGALERPTSGRIDFGSDSTAVQLDALAEGRLASVRASQIGFIFQGFNLIPTLSALDNVMAGLRPIGIRGAEAARRAQEALEMVGLHDRVEHLPAALSGGQQQRVAIARALVKKPDVILADEPTGNLDEMMRLDIISLFERIWYEQSVTLVMVTHDSSVASRAQRILHLENGSLLADIAA
ncbi:MAG: transporter ATP-binding protein [Subtercola sp.]|nr:transporter ATP-binding protein [Subtercola sp.]